MTASQDEPTLSARWIAPVAQRIGHRASKPRVAGSIPAGRANSGRISRTAHTRTKRVAPPSPNHLRSHPASVKYFLRH
jgi:hypothetical protein